MSDDDWNVIWPIPEDGISVDDAYSTLYALSDAKLNISNYEDDGDTIAENLYVDLSDNDYFMNFKRQLLIELLIDGLGDEVDDINKELRAEEFLSVWRPEQSANYYKTTRLFVRLIRAYRDWENTEAKMTWEELVANPLPARN